MFNALFKEIFGRDPPAAADPIQNMCNRGNRVTSEPEALCSQHKSRLPAELNTVTHPVGSVTNEKPSVTGNGICCQRPVNSGYAVTQLHSDTAHGLNACSYWDYYFEERAAIREFDGGLDRQEAELAAAGDCVSHWLSLNPPLPEGPNTQCAQCGETTGSRSSEFVPVLGKAGGLRVHDHCWAAWLERRQAIARVALQAFGLRFSCNELKTDANTNKEISVRLVCQAHGQNSKDSTDRTRAFQPVQ